MTTTIYHNPVCSKSRATLALLQEQGITPSIRLYLKDSPSADELKALANMLNITSARDMMRTGEKDYKEQNLADKSLSQEVLIAAIATTPKLLERPIVINNNQARIGRPPEKVLEIL